jgi:micrococcal nuclease
VPTDFLKQAAMGSIRLMAGALLLGACIAVVLLGIGDANSPPEGTSEGTSKWTDNTNAVGTRGAGGSEETTTGAANGAGRGRYDAETVVKEVLDGDSLKIEPAVKGKEDVRLLGVDAPEVEGSGSGEKAQPYGGEAANFTRTVLEGEEVGLEFDVAAVLTDDDGDQLLVAYVYPRGEEMFNEDLLELGYAQVYSVPSLTRYEGRFEAAQAEAREARLGIWGLPKREQCELDDRGNGIGVGTPGCVAAPETTPTPDATATPGATATGTATATATPGGSP